EGLAGWPLAACWPQQFDGYDGNDGNSRIAPHGEEPPFGGAGKHFFGTAAPSGHERLSEVVPEEMSTQCVSRECLRQWAISRAQHDTLHRAIYDWIGP